MRDVVLSASGVSRRFGDVVALDGVDLACHRGEVHALLGENGAGKSTLMHVVSGLVRPDSGEIRLRDRKVRWASADEARVAGISMVHQHFMLVPTLTISENVALAWGLSGFLDRVALGRRVRALAEKRAIDVGDPDRRVEELSVGEQQRVEILKALTDVPSLLILDEPTAVLTPGEVEDLFAIVRHLAEAGTAVVIVTHRLAEVFALAERVTVLRGGRVVGSGPISEYDADGLARLMVGDRRIERAAHGRTKPTGRVVLSARGLTWPTKDGRRALDEVDLSVEAGEIVVVAGVEGNGQQELQDALAGIRPAGSAGEVSIGGRRVLEPRDARGAGLAIVPADRRRDGLVEELTLWENLLVGREPLLRAAPRGWLRPSAEKERSRKALEDFAVRPCDPEAPAAALSGGNQQRLVLARELSCPSLVAVLAANPTRGLDLVATAAVHERLRCLAAAGVAVLVLSTDLDEVEALADRVLVLYRGRPYVPARGVDRVEIGRLMAGIGVAA